MITFAMKCVICIFKQCFKITNNFSECFNFVTIILQELGNPIKIN